VKNGLIIIALLIMAAGVGAQDKDKGNNHKTNRVADSGSFGIFIQGKRVGTETFRIEEGTDVSAATSTLKVDDGTTKAEQTSEMRLDHSGNLRLYRWRSTAPTKEETVVEPNEDLLVEHIVPADLKKMDLPHILPLSTSILDDNFFSHREILAWRFIATNCPPDKDGRRSCTPGDFSILVPRQHLAGNARVELVGRNAIKVKGVEREMDELKVDTGGALWLIWIGEDLKVMKISIPSNGVEVIRD
jgi:hypothetical protein